MGVALLLIGSIACGDVLVTTTADENNGSLNPALGAGVSLREAVLHAPDASVIGFAPALDGQTFTLTLGQIPIGKNLSISASSLATGVIVSGNHASRVFSVSSSKTVTLTALDLVNGDVTGDGGAILNAGNLTLDRCELFANEASDGGGAIENSGTLTLTACTLAGNTAEVGGGAIEHASGTLTATNCTFSGNTAEFGGAIDGDDSSTIRLYSCTLSGNHATNDGGGIEESSGTLLLENTIVAGNTAVDQGPDLKASSINTQAGVNLLSSTSGLGGSFGGIVASPNLAALADNGGRTRTMLPLAGSPAINAGGTTALTTDQRGLTRVVGAAVDIGAVEVQAAPIVTTTANAGPGSLRDIIAAAPAGATVTFAPALDGSTIILASPIILSKDVTLDASARTNLVVSGGIATRLFTVNSGVTATFLGMAMWDGFHPSGPGAAIHNSGHLTLADCWIKGCLAAEGAGIFNGPSGVLTLTDCKLEGNFAFYDGGGLYNLLGTATMTRVTVTGNAAGTESGSGGGLYNGGSLLMTDCLVVDNSAQVAGGIASGGSLELTRTTVADNVAWDGGGGGVLVTGLGGTITACTISGNSCLGSGGGIFHGGGDLTVASCSISGNSSDYEHGGGIAAFAGGPDLPPADYLLDVVSCTLANNEAGEEGGGIHVAAGSRLRLENTIIAGNSASTAGPDLRGAIETQAGVNLVASTAGIDGPFTGLVAPTQLGPLSDNGGPTLTMLPQPGSPVIDAGGSTTLTVDQRGLPRIVGAAVDIGAVEVQGGPIADTWETLASPPFPHGVSGGGGLATDGHYIYAADLSGDGDGDFIDLDDDGIKDVGESLAELGIANASVRFARFDPVEGTWQSLPAIAASGFTGDAFSRENFNGPLFHAGGRLYYYQLRSGPDTAVLYRYDLAAAPGGAWEAVWEKSFAQALLEPSAGMVAVEAVGGPVLLHHRGGGSRDFCRTSLLDSGGQHVVLTPNWPNSGANFPRNGAWEFDPLRGRLYHLSGNQLIAWSPSTSFKDAGSPYERGSFLTSQPLLGRPLALYETPLASLKTSLGWNPGGSFANPGASVWGNSITVVNDPSGVSNGPAGEDTGANAVYLVRGETTPDEWPFNEGRGQVTNGDFARWFATTGNVQALPDAPFHVGKGSDSVYLGGYLYLTQGETRNSADGPGNDAPINGDGIRRPGTGFARFRIQKTTARPEDNDLSVAWIQRLPLLDYVWGSPQPDIDGWPAAGSTVTWRAMVKNWSPVPRADVGYRWLLDGNLVASGTVDLLVGGHTAVDLPRTWSFDRHTLAFEIDPANAVAEFSELNNRVDTWTDAITVGFWVEHSFYQYMHRFQQELPGTGSNSFEDWAQRQVKLWNDKFADADHPVDAPQGVLDRVRLDRITIAADDMLPLTGDNDVRTNKPDKADRTVDLMWGFASWRTPGKYGEGYMEEDVFQNPATRGIVSETNPFYHDWVLFHESGHARYLADVYSFNVQSSTDWVNGLQTGSRIEITLAGLPVEGTRYMPRVFQDHLFYANGNESTSPFFGLMAGDYSRIDRYSAMAMNRIAGHRATRGNYNGPQNGAIYLDDLPDDNTVQVSDGHGKLLAGATVRLYRGERGSSGSYPKIYDDVADSTLTADAYGRVEVGRNPFTNGTPVVDEGVEVIILRADSAGKTGFGFLPVGLFNMESWRGNTSHGRHELAIAMIGPDPEIARVVAWRTNGDWKLRIVTGGTTQPASVLVDGHSATRPYGDAWEVTIPFSSSPIAVVSVTWPGGPTLTETVLLDPPPFVPQLHPQKIPGGLNVGWWSRAGYRYTLEHSADLFDWSPADSGTVHFGTGGWMEADDLVPAVSGRGFSRLQVERLTD